MRALYHLQTHFPEIADFFQDCQAGLCLGFIQTLQGEVPVSGCVGVNLEQKPLVLGWAGDANTSPFLQPCPWVWSGESYSEGCPRQCWVIHWHHGTRSKSD